MFPSECVFSDMIVVVYCTKDEEIVSTFKEHDLSVLNVFNGFMDK